MGRIRDCIGLFAVASLVGLVAVTQAAAANKKPPKPVSVQLLAFNDFHGHLEASTPGAISRTDGLQDRVPAGGAEYFATHVRMLQRRNRNTLLVSAGDLIGASPMLSALFHDEPTIEAMNRIGLDLHAVGNHEFDEGVNELRRMKRGGCHPKEGCRDGNGFRGARFGFLAANVISRRTGRTLFPAYAIRRFGRVRVGFIGMTLKDTPALVPPVVSDRMRFRDEARAINRSARRLQRRGVEAIVVLLHEGGFPLRVAPIDDCPGISGPLDDIVRRTTGAVDVFVTGHTHASYNCVIDGRRVTSARSYGRLLTRIELEIAPRSGEVRDVTADNWIVGQDVMRAPDISELIARYARLADPLRNRLIGRLMRPASRWKDRSGESRIGNLVADAQREATGADAAFVNPGGVRAGLSAGDVSYGAAFRAQPFGTSLVTMTLNGDHLYELLKQQWCDQRSAQILQPSHGVSYTWSRAAAAAIVGEPCETAENPVTDLRISGVPVHPAGRYRVTLNAMLAGGGNGFTVLRSGLYRDGGAIDSAALEAHLQPSLKGQPLDPPKLDRIERVP